MALDRSLGILFSSKFKMHQKEEAYMLKREIASHFRVSPRSINNWIRLGMPHVKIGRVLRFKIRLVEEWVRRRFGGE